MQAIFGILFLLFFCWIISENRKLVSLKLISIGIFLQVILALFFLKLPVITSFFLSFNVLISALDFATTKGSTFLFGFLGGGEQPYESISNTKLYLFAFRVLPQVIVFSAIVALMWHWKILIVIIDFFGTFLQKFFKLSGPLGLAAAASLFLGMIETPILIRAYLKKLSRSEFFSLMTLGMSTAAGTVMILYFTILSDLIPGIVGHIISASILNIIGAIYVSRIIIPDNYHSKNKINEDKSDLFFSYTSTMDALSQGTKDGLQLALNIGAMLLVLISLVSLINLALSSMIFFDKVISLELIFGLMFSPVAWLIGIPWKECITAGSLLGTKLILNEVIAFIQLKNVENSLSEQSKQIMLYALCGFANLGSLGILVGGLNILIPERKIEFLKMAPYSIISGTVVSLLTASIISLVSKVM